MTAPLYLALLHHPVLNRDGHIVTTSVTNLDIHDIARSARTYDIAGYFVAHPSTGLRALCERVSWHWQDGYGAKINESRRLAMELVHVVPDLDHVITAIENQTGRVPTKIATSARDHDRPVTSFKDLRTRIETEDDPILVLLGTGYGLSPEILDDCASLLEPLRGPTDYNHLSVRAAAAILLDRLRGF